MPISHISTTLVVILTATLAISQQPAPSFTAANFPTEILQFNPVQREGVSKASYDIAVHILDETRKAAKGDPQNLNAADYWNITTALNRLHEPTQSISLAFSQAIKSDPKTICGYVQALGPSKLDVAIPETFLPFYADCLSQGPSTDVVDPADYASKNHLNVELVTQIQQIFVDDRRYRLVQPFDAEKQRPFDLKNQQDIAALFAKYKTYIGRSLVGKEYESVMWAVIQHSNPEMMEQFLPVVQKAVADKELAVTPLKMLIDRVYAIRTKQQIFGSQGGVPLADENTRAAVMQKYGLS